MPIDIWGATDTIAITAPQRPLGLALLVFYILLLGYLLFRSRESLRRLSARRWLLTFTLALLALLFSQLLPIHVKVTGGLLPTLLGWPPNWTLNLLSAVPYLFAATLLGPGPAIIVGLSTGLGHALGQSHSLFSPFHYAFAATFAAALIAQNYRGRGYRWLRQPMLAGPLSQISIALMVGLATLVSVAAPFLVALDAAILATQTSLWPLLLEGLVAGVLVGATVKLVPTLHPELRLVPSPTQRSITRHLTAFFIFFALVALLLEIVVVVSLSARFSQALVIQQLAAGTNAAAAQVGALQSSLENVLAQVGSEEPLINADRLTRNRSLGRAFRTGQYYQRVLLVEEELQVAEAFPRQGGRSTLTVAEQQAVDRAVADRLRTTVVSPAEDGARTVSVVVPVLEDGRAVGALVGRVPEATFTGALQGLYWTVEQGGSLVLGGENEYIAAVGEPAVAATSTGYELAPANQLPGQAYVLQRPDSGSRLLLYEAPVADRVWSVLATVPYALVLRQALGVGLPLALLLFAVSAVFYSRVRVYGFDLSQPLKELTYAARAIANGGRPSPPVGINRADEVGELGRAFTDMQLGLKRRLDELSLLLSVSQEIATSININETMPVLLQGALRGSGASGARAVILNPSGGHPLTFAEGPAGPALEVFDRAVMSALRQVPELTLGAPGVLRATLQYDEQQALPAKALYALPIQSQNRFQGVFFLGYAQTHTFDRAERHLLRTLAGQASMLVENAHLFANAESGRRRLAAVLASIREAVIVTDQTERVLIINRAMERAFRLKASAVKGRPVADVIPSEQLVRALTGGGNGAQDLEIRGRDRRTYYANASTIVNQEGTFLGRVAVLHDVTDLKEIDRMKSEFVDSVSHDLRTPLTIISGYATSLAMEDLTPKQQGFADGIVTAVERMRTMVENLLDLGQIEAGVDLSLQPVNVGEMLREVADEHWLHAHQSAVKLIVEAEEDLPPVQADPMRLRQAVTNLLMNAFKYAAHSGPVTLSAARERNSICISVRDHGPGIPKQDQIRLFEKFYRLERHTKAGTSGTGMGLAIVKSIAERHGGAAWCRSDLGKGSTFTVSLPISGPPER